MNITKDITINISPEDVAQLIVDYLLKEGYETAVKDVNFLVGTKCEGYGMAEHYIDYFKGCNVHVKEFKR